MDQTHGEQVQRKEKVVLETQTDKRERCSKDDGVRERRRKKGKVSVQESLTDETKRT